MTAQKRTHNGAPKPKSSIHPQPQPQHQDQDISILDTPPCDQAQTTAAKKAKTAKPTPQAPSPTKPAHTQVASHRPSKKSNRPTKRPPLPPNTTTTRRPLLHPSIPTPFSSADHPKVLYITATSPFIPSCKRIRSLLSRISARAAQSASEPPSRRRKNVQANGRLEARDVEAGIVDAVAAAGRGKGKGRGAGVGEGEMVYLKATGRAIPRALSLGVKFQGEEDCFVRVEMGRVSAIDDVEVCVPEGTQDGINGAEAEEDEEEVPETRIRVLSTVTVCIGLR
ncbi:hypothetical protein E8E13_000751 [Curvularia kusanoi]|uniref:Uncharacterized protein n=1 Tax=Curvularia kusanoi TaxID=90978 RepID=A0A9P4TGX2_CURKU|nr:hypothetical protein E8E13_000751 [Curvularia kusanoi]